MRKTINKQWLIKNKACCSKNDMQEAHKIKDVRKICNALLKANRFKDANWLITKILTKNKCIQYAIYAAKQVLYMFEEKYPNDDRPRKAIQAAKKYLKNPTQKNKNAAYAAANAANAAYAAVNAAANAAYAAYAAVNAAAYAAVNAAYAAYAAAYAAVNAAANAANAAYAAYAAVNAAANAAAYAANAAMKKKIIRYGIKLIYGDKK